MSNLKISSKGLRFYAPLTNKYLQSATLASDVSAYHNHATSVTGTPTYSSVGVDLDGTNENILFPATGVFSGSYITMAMRFTPDFEADDGAQHVFVDTTNGSRFTILKRGLNDILVYLGNTLVASPVLATYQAYWLTDQENTIIVTGDSVADLTNVWLNGNQIVTDSSTAWSAADPSTLYVGTNYVGTTPFDGEIRDLMIYDRIWTAAERAAYEAGSQGLYAPKKLSTLHKGLRFYAPLTDRYLQSSTLASELGPNHGHATSAVGTPTYSSAGIDVQDDQRIIMPLNGALNSDSITIAVRFTPDESWDANIWHEIFATEGGAGVRWSMLKLNDASSNNFRIRIANTIIVDLAPAVYSEHWVVGQETTFILSTTESTPSTSAWMNGNRILNSAGTAYTKGPYAQNLYVSGINATLDFDGRVRDIRIWDRILTADERAEYEAETLATRQKVSTLQKGLLFDMPLTSTYTSSSTEPIDRSPYSHTTTDNNSVVIDSNGALYNNSADYLDTTSDLLNFGDGSDDSAFSVSIWVKQTDRRSCSFFALTDEWYLGILHHATNWDGPYLHIRDESASAYLRRYGLAGFQSFSNTWRMVTCTYNGNEDLTGMLCYVDGVLPTQSYSTGGSYTAMEDLGSDVRFGGGSGSFHFKGYLSGAKVWNRVLTAAEVLELYNKGRP